jgi:hypothetical protein
MTSHEYDNLTTAREVMKTQIVKESGRTLGFLHNLESGRERLKGQIKGLVQAKTTSSITEGSALDHVLSEYSTDNHGSFRQMVADAFSRMKFNSSSGFKGGGTALQEIASNKYSDIPSFLNADRS